MSYELFHDIKAMDVVTKSLAKVDASALPSALLKNVKSLERQTTHFPNGVVRVIERVHFWKP